MTSRIAFLFARPRTPQSQADGFEAEWDALEAVDGEAHLVDFEALVDGDADEACASLPRRLWVYRGWMLTADEYEGLAEAVASRGGRLLTDPSQYEAATYVPAWYPALADCTPATRWIEGTDLDEAWEAACELGPPPGIVKDHVKSARDRWHQACFVPEGADRDDFRAVCEALVDERGERFERGIVIRSFVRFATLGHAMPERAVPDEHRLFFVCGRLVAQAPYFEVESPPIEPSAVAFLGRRIDSPFFTADVARLPDGGLAVVEVNDGGVSTLPPLLSPVEFYEAFLARFRR